MTIVVLVGLPGSGKSTWLAGRSLVAISSDEIRRTLADDPTCQTINARVFATVRYLIRQRLQMGREVTYIDATSLTRKERRQYFEIARKFGATVEALYFDVPLDVCKLRNRLRDRVVPDAAMDRLAARLQPPAMSEGFSRVTVVADRTRPKGRGAATRKAR